MSGDELSPACAARTSRSIDVRLSVELCSVYWHFLLLVWLGLFAVMLST